MPDANIVARTRRTANWGRLQWLMRTAGIRCQRNGSYGLMIVHPLGYNSGYMLIRLSQAPGKFARVRAFGLWPNPLEPGPVLWAETADQARTQALAIEYEQTGRRAP